MDTEIIKIILAFVVLINPFGALGLFLDLTKGYTPSDRRKVAQIACLTIFVTITFFTILGESLLKVLGISVGSFQIAGGILVFLIAISMMNGTGNPVKPNEGDIEVTGSFAASAVVPLAIPMMIGPGGISTVIIYSSQIKGMMTLMAILIAGFLLSVFCYLCLMAAGKISRFLGDTGLSILSRVMGMLLAAVAVEIVVNGLKATFPEMMG
ncbi:MAG: MarC family protein [Moraxella sp.]|nr:MarC family protein [Moraxella sp.]